MLPISRVVLFKHGVGYFQRTGKVQGEQVVELAFKTEQMNDVLKSLTALDFDGGSFAALSYDSEEPIERRLAELNMDIPPKGAISDFMDRLKGARVAVPRGSQQLVGVVVGIEDVQRGGKEGVHTEPHLAVLDDEGCLLRIPLLEVEELHLLDESVQRDLRTLLDIRFSSLRKDRKRLSIQALGEGARRVSLSYVIEAPVWKTSYRIVLPGAGDEDKPLLQGWALVDNTTEDDWQGVSLSLVAGLPISFIHDLYKPRYRQRPVIRVEQEAAVAPPVIEAGIPGAVMGAAGPAAAGMMDMAPAAPKAMSPARAKRMAPPPPPAPMARAARESVQVHTHTQEVGDLFAYEIGQAVDVARGRSALVPILQSAVDCERVVLYNPEIRDKNPMTAFRIHNDTGLVLEGGPVTVFEAETYVGEAMLDTLRKEEERITPYSVELGVTVERKSRAQREDFTRVSKRGQTIYKHYRELSISEYRLHSRLDRSLSAYLDHRFTYPLREDTPEPIEVTEHFWRFKLTLPPGETTHFEVREVHKERESIHIPSIALVDIERMVESALIGEEQKAALEAVAERAARIVELQEKLEKKTREAEKIEDGQQRIRENLMALGSTSEEGKLRQRYVAKLAAEEERLEALRSECQALEAQIEAEREALDASVDELEID
ncbi:MAG: hypothetical protein JXR96_14835 [Deltaproteobacteria bacterium]|nr:hypothetical protein [Deltaproteobacteria bacterium]